MREIPMRMNDLLRVTFLALMFVASSAIAKGEEAVTFHKDVEPILQENCLECHRSQGTNMMGMVAPMAFDSFAATRPWAKAIAKQVNARTMPPWHASAEFDGVFENERKLTDAEIDTLASWARTGARRGDPSDAPAPVTFADSDGWSIGEPDLIVEFDEPYLVADHIEDHYATIVATVSLDQLPEDRWIKAMDFRPGSEAVHHIVVFTGSERESLGFGQGMLGGMGPGTNATVFPEGYGRLLPKGEQLMFNMHYHKEPGPGTAVWDKSSMAFTFQDKPVKHAVNWGAVGNMSFRIPAYADNHEVVATETFRRDTIFMSLFPHTHLRGKASKYVAYYPDGKQETLLHVPAYDFNWQTNYIFKTPKLIPAGTKVEVSMWYDNSEARAERAGIDPSRTVGWGQPTTDEMMYGWIDYCDAEPIESGD
jgi:mono/diheme cytochrome c family protein